MPLRTRVCDDCWAHVCAETGYDPHVDDDACPRPSSRAELAALTRHSRNANHASRPDTPQHSPSPARGTRADGNHHLPANWRAHLPYGWRPAAPAEAMQAFDQWAQQQRWRSDGHTTRRRIWQIWISHADPATRLIQVSHQRVATLYQRIYGTPVSTETISQLLRAARRDGLALEVECAASTGRGRAATYAVLTPGPPPDDADPGPRVHGLTQRDATTSANSLDYGPSVVSDPSRDQKPMGHLNARANAGTREEELLHARAPESTRSGWKHRARITRALISRCGLGKCTYRLTRALAPWYQAGWTGYQLLTYFDRQPTRRRHPTPARNHSTRDTVAVCLHRLHLWSQQQGREQQTPVQDGISIRHKKNPTADKAAPAVGNGRSPR